MTKISYIKKLKEKRKKKKRKKTTRKTNAKKKSRIGLWTSHSATVKSWKI
jgi:hypothetical protein